MGTAVAAAIDYLVTQIRALPECADPVLVSDGWPDAKGENVTVSIGVTNEDGTSEVNAEWAGLGANREDETFAVPVLIESYRGGGQEVMAEARSAAVTIFDAINAKVRLDRSLGGALAPGWAGVRDMRLIQTNTQEEASDGRYARIYFNVQCQNRF